MYVPTPVLLVDVDVGTVLADDAVEVKVMLVVKAFDAKRVDEVVLIAPVDEADDDKINGDDGVKVPLVTLVPTLVDLENVVVLELGVEEPASVTDVVVLVLTIALIIVLVGLIPL